MKRWRWLTAFGLGLLFGVGLAVSQMTDPWKVLSFLTIDRRWDPSLIVVMLCAGAVTMAGYRWVLKRPPALASEHHLPTASDIDARLVAGAALFGVGWGLAGYCPGPVIANLASGSPEPFIFIPAMLIGAALAGFLKNDT